MEKTIIDSIKERIKFNFIQKMEYKTQMESKFSQEISSICRLDFSNSIVKKPKGLFYTKNVQQYPINFRKKNEKISLKNINQEQSSPDEKNAQHKHQLQKPEALNIKTYTQQNLKNLSAIKFNPRVTSPNINAKKFSQPESSFKIKLHKSLEQEPQRIQKPKRNVIEELKSIGLKKISASQKINYFHPSNIIVHKYSGNLINENSRYCNKARIETQSNNVLPQMMCEKKEKNCEPYFAPIHKLNESVKKMITPEFSEGKNEKRTMNLESTELNKNIKESLASTKPQEQKIKSENTVERKRFREEYGEFELEEQIKYDLLVQKETLRSDKIVKKEKENVKQNICFHSQKHNNPEELIQFFKIKRENKEEENESVNEESIKREFDRIFYNSCENKQMPHTFNSFEKLEKIEQSPSLENYQFKTEERLKKSSISIESEVSIEGNYINSMEFREKCQRADNFKTIVSVHSESVTDEEVEASVIINKHPKEIISSKPIRSLF